MRTKNNKPFSQSHHPVFLVPFPADPAEASADAFLRHLVSAFPVFSAPFSQQLVLNTKCVCGGGERKNRVTDVHMESHSGYIKKQVQTFPNIDLNGKTLHFTTAKDLPPT